MKKIVIKIGTSSLVSKNGELDIEKIESFVHVISKIKQENTQVTLVTSGAVGVGFSVLQWKKGSQTMAEKQAAAAVGQCQLMYLYDGMFSSHGEKVAQILLTKDIFAHKGRKQNVINTFHTLLSHGCIPIVNENDTVATDEIEFGDNDTLSALVATLVGADLLIIVSDIEGLYDKDPRKFQDARLISEISHITREIEHLAGDAGSPFGTGGMITKISAAKILEQANIDMMIVNGAEPHNIFRGYQGEKVGTYFKFRR